MASSSNIGNKINANDNSHWKVLCEKKTTQLCGHCQDKGHQTKTCPQIQCYFCGKLGHVKKLCWAFYLNKYNKMLKIYRNNNVKNKTNIEDCNFKCRQFVNLECNKFEIQISSSTKLVKTINNSEKPFKKSIKNKNKINKEKCHKQNPPKKTPEEKRLNWLKGKTRQKPWVIAQKRLETLKLQIKYEEEYNSIVEQVQNKTLNDNSQQLSKLNFEPTLTNSNAKINFNSIQEKEMDSTEVAIINPNKVKEHIAAQVKSSINQNENITSEFYIKQKNPQTLNKLIQMGTEIRKLIQTKQNYEDKYKMLLDEKYQIDEIAKVDNESSTRLAKMFLDLERRSAARKIYDTIIIKGKAIKQLIKEAKPYQRDYDELIKLKDQIVIVDNFNAEEGQELKTIYESIEFAIWFAKVHSK
jgi:hypothetical protein